jgi:2-polyprenyl-3-methyl-5-hydroxy-6-metoxy-1,4-benzoquinol methylase
MSEGHAKVRGSMDPERHKLRSYVSRWDFILERCQKKRVLHLGCIGMTERSIADKALAMCERRVLHPLIKQVAADVIGVDKDEAAVMQLYRLGWHEIIAADVANLQDLRLGNDFDVIVCGDLIEHLSDPGCMLDAVRSCMQPRTELLITTPNAFGLHNILSYTAGQPVDGADHVLSFNIHTLGNLLSRHGYELEECFSCYDRPPKTAAERLLFRVGGCILKIVPKFGGTLAVVARLSSDCR